MRYFLEKFHFTKYRHSIRSMIERWLGNMNQFEIEVASNCLLTLQMSNEGVICFQNNI